MSVLFSNLKMGVRLPESNLWRSKVKEAFALAGVNSKRYSGHSFCIGAATTAAKQGISDASIKMLGRWRSSAYQVYIKTPRHQLASFIHRLGESLQMKIMFPLEIHKSWELEWRDREGVSGGGMDRDFYPCVKIGAN